MDIIFASSNLIYMRQKTSVILILLVLFLLKTSIAISQTDTTWSTYNEYLEPATDTSIKFLGGLIKLKNSWEFILENVQNNSLLMRGHYSDSLLKVKDGKFEYFFENGVLRMLENYEKDKPIGIWVRGDQKRIHIDSSIYENGEVKTDIQYNYYLSGFISMYSYDDAINKRLSIKYYYDSGGIRNEIEYLKGRQISNKDFYKNGQLKGDIRNDEKGKKVYAKHFSENGEEISEQEFEKQQKKSMADFLEKMNKEIPEFRGGWGAFQNYVQQNLVIPRNLTQERGSLDKVTISFYLNEMGRAEKIKLDGINDSDLLRNVTSLLERMPAWDMKGKKSYGPVRTSINFIQ